LVGGAGGSAGATLAFGPASLRHGPTGHRYPSSLLSVPRKALAFSTSRIVTSRRRAVVARQQDVFRRLGDGALARYRGVGDRGSGAQAHDDGNSTPVLELPDFIGVGLLDDTLVSETDWGIESRVAVRVRPDPPPPVRCHASVPIVTSRRRAVVAQREVIHRMCRRSDAGWQPPSDAPTGCRSEGSTFHGTSSQAITRPGSFGRLL
jgi:hypothetical protein